ncbi:MAG: hypothetical protein L3K05_04445 [Thermoplasmata archaeon]|nr:hypothetical protein [Thermoplasmata archaeon]
MTEQIAHRSATSLFRPNARPSARGLWVPLVSLVFLLAILPSVALGAPAPATAAAPSAASTSVAGALPGGGAPFTPASFGGSPALLPIFHLGNFALHGPHPSSWGSSGVPPGWEAMAPNQRTHSTAGSWDGSPTGSSWDNRFCAGLWPGTPTINGVGAQQRYAADCYGHDEPGIQFFSNLPGSGGNVSWNVTLPIDRSPTLNQSNLYSAIWFGMALTDPLGWLGQCFLELQFYPDQTFYNPGPMFPNATVNGAWIGAAVAWQIEASTGAENPCFYSPLYLNGMPGPAFLNMTQGDHVSIVMTGSQTSTTGEQVSVVDGTNGQRSNLTLFDPVGNFPLNPAYSTNSYPAAFQWTPGGEYPVAFAYETGHAGNPNWPSNNSFGGCSGGPTSTPTDPGAPCPSYDPASWAADTLQPWHIDTPTFFNSHGTQTPSQVAFTQPEGGMDLVDQTSNGVCNALEGSSWCSYPWYSYSCPDHTFEFGATDYNGTSADFGKYTQFARTSQTNALGIPFFPPSNFSVPSCARAGFQVGVASSAPAFGVVDFLSHQYGALTTVGGVSGGAYSLHAIGLSGAGFRHWTTTGSVAVAISTDPYTTLTVSGNGSVTAVFTTVPTTTMVTFRDAPLGFVGVDASMFLQGNGGTQRMVVNGGSLALPPGIYAIQSYPAQGYNFTSWSGTGLGIQLAAPAFISTWLTVTGQSTTATVTAHTTASPVTSTAILVAIGSGTVRLGNLTVSNSRPGFTEGFATVPVGTYPLALTPTATTSQVQVLYGTSVVLSDFAHRSHATLQNGTAIIEAIFVAAATLSFHDSPSAGGGISVQGPGGPPGAVLGNGATATLVDGSYVVEAVPSTGYTFVGWSTGTPGSVTIASPSSIVSGLGLSGSGAVTAHFLATSSVARVTFLTTSGSGGTIAFDLQTTYTSGSTNSAVTVGQHAVTATAALGWTFQGWRGSGGHVTVPAGAGATTVMMVFGNGSLQAQFAPTTFAVTFVAYNPEGNPLPGAVAFVDGQALHSGDTTSLTWGSHTVRLFSEDALRDWRSTPGTRLSGLNTNPVTLTVHSAGTIYAILWDSDAGNDTGGNHAPFHGTGTHVSGSTGPLAIRPE